MKVCTKCKKEKELSEFHKDKYTKDGLTFQCAECRRTSARSWRQTDRGKEVHRIDQAKFLKTEKGKQSIRRYRTNHPVRLTAHSYIASLIYRNKIPSASKLRCQICNDQAAQYHHSNGYEGKNKANVIPVCRKCHNEIHKIRKFSG